LQVGVRPGFIGEAPAFPMLRFACAQPDLPAELSRNCVAGMARSYNNEKGSKGVLSRKVRPGKAVLALPAD
jgi:hypothetical protein